MESVKRLAQEVQRGLGDALPKPLEKNAGQADSESGYFKKLYRSSASWFRRGLWHLMPCLQNGLPLPAFY